MGKPSGTLRKGLVIIKNALSTDRHIILVSYTYGNNNYCNSLNNDVNHCTGNFLARGKFRGHSSADKILKDKYAVRCEQTDRIKKN